MTRSAIHSWHRTDGRGVFFSLGGEAISIDMADVDRLVRALRQSELVAAASICEEISARALTGRVELGPTEAELEVLVSTLERLSGICDESSGVTRLLALGRALRDDAETSEAEARPIGAVLQSRERTLSDRRKDRV